VGIEAYIKCATKPPTGSRKGSPSIHKTTCKTKTLINPFHSSQNFAFLALYCHFVLTTATP
jgi:hypothetical protein